MKKFFLIAILYSLAVNVSAQQDTTVYDFPETEAEPKGGISEFWLSLLGSFDNIENTDELDITCLGRIHLLFIVEIDGTVTHLNCIDHCGHTFDTALFADRFKEKWTPATIKGKAVRSKYHIPINIDFH